MALGSLSNLKAERGPICIVRILEKTRPTRSRACRSLARGGFFHSEDMKVFERFTRNGDQMLDDIEFQNRH